MELDEKKRERSLLAKLDVLPLYNRGGRNKSNKKERRKKKRCVMHADVRDEVKDGRNFDS